MLANKLLLGNNGTTIAPGLLVVLHFCGRDRGRISDAMMDIARDYMADILQFDCKNKSATITVGFFMYNKKLMTIRMKMLVVRERMGNVDFSTFQD